MLNLATKDTEFILQVYQNQSLSKSHHQRGAWWPNTYFYYTILKKKIHILGKEQILTFKSNIGNRQEGADLIKVKKDF